MMTNLLERVTGRRNVDGISLLIPNLRKTIVVSVVLGVVGGVLDAATFVMIAAAAVGTTSDSTVELTVGFEPSVTTALVLALIAIVVRFAVSLLYTSLITRWSAAIATRTRRETLRRYLGATWTVQRTISPTTFQQATVQDAEQVGYWLTILLSIVGVIASVVVSLLAAAVISPLGVLAAMALSPFVFVVIRPVSSRTKSESTRYAAQVADAGHLLSGLTQVARELRGTDLQGLRAHVDRALYATGAQWRRARFYAQIQGQIAQTFAILLVVGGILIAASLSTASATGSFGAAALIALRASTALQGAQAQYASLRASTPYLERTLLHWRTLDAAAQPAGGEVIGTIETVDFESVVPQFGVLAAGHAPMDIRLSSGDSLALTGRSGGGKTTLLDIVAGLGEPASGRVLINGVDVSRLDRWAYWRRIGLVTQEFGMIPGTVLDNITLYATTTLSTQLAERAARLLDLDAPALKEFLERDVATLSGGQRQRVALLRALGTERDLLLLDEPSSGLDDRAEVMLMDAVREHCAAGGIAVLVTHRRGIADACSSEIDI